MRARPSAVFFILFCLCAASRQSRRNPRSASG
nr:MAG TPA: hypothetical protein [Caudoviricetes sp.]